MWRLLPLALCLVEASASPSSACGSEKDTLELGQWRPDMRHLDAVIVEHPPSDHIEGQAFVYENTFKASNIRYISVDNLAVKSCGALAAVSRGGLGSSEVVIVLHAAPYQEIRSVIDVWGELDASAYEKRKKVPPHVTTSNKDAHMLSKLGPFFNSETDHSAKIRKIL